MSFADIVESARALLCKRQYRVASNRLPTSSPLTLTTEESELKGTLTSFIASMLTASTKTPVAKIAYLKTIDTAPLSSFEQCILYREIAEAHDENKEIAASINYFEKARTALKQIDTEVSSMELQELRNEILPLLAKNYRENHDFTRAREIYALLMQDSYPKNIQFHACLQDAKVLFAAGDYTAAMTAFESLQVQLEKIPLTFLDGDCSMTENFMPSKNSDVDARRKAIKFIKLYITHLNIILNRPLSSSEFAPDTSPDPNYSHYILAMLKLQEGKIEEARAHLTQYRPDHSADCALLNEYDYYHALYYEKSIVTPSDGYKELACESLRKMLEQNPKHWQSHCALGRLSNDSNEFNRAIQLTDQALNDYDDSEKNLASTSNNIQPYLSPSKKQQLVDDYISALIESADYHQRAGSLDEATQYYEKAIQYFGISDTKKLYCSEKIELVHQQQEKEPSLESGIEYAKQGHYVSALNVYHHILINDTVLKKTRFQAWLNRSKLFFDVGDYPAALQSYQNLYQCLEENYFSAEDYPTHEKEEILRHIAHLHHRLSIPYEAKECEYNNYRSDDTEYAYYVRAMIKLDRGLTRNALADLNHGAKNPNLRDVDTLLSEKDYYRGLCHANMPSKTDADIIHAISSFLKMLEKNPAHWPSYCALGRLHEDLSYFNMAVQLAKKQLDDYCEEEASTKGINSANKNSLYVSHSKRARLQNDYAIALTERGSFCFCYRLVNKAEQDFQEALAQTFISENYKKTCSDKLVDIQKLKNTLTNPQSPSNPVADNSSGFFSKQPLSIAQQLALSTKLEISVKDELAGIFQRENKLNSAGVQQKMAQRKTETQALKDKRAARQGGQGSSSALPIPVLIDHENSDDRRLSI